MDLMRRRILMGSILAAVGCGNRLWAEIAVCPFCGREHAPGLSKCPHCGGQLAVTETPEEKPPAPDSASESAGPINPSIPIALAMAEFESAQKSFGQNLDWLAMRQARNSRALAAIAEGERAAVLAGASKLISAARDRLSEDRIPCPICDGTGKKNTLASNLRGEIRVVEAPNAYCDACRGERKITVKRGFRTSATARAEQIRAFEAAEEGKGFVRSAKTWLPGNVDIKILKPREIAAMRRAFTQPCEECGGLGAEACVTCRGAGIQVCPQSNCEGGRIPCPECKGTKYREETSDRSGRVVRVRCSNCNSMGHVLCPDCNGKHYVACKKCEGQGADPCRRCKGAGVPPDCVTCKTDGVVPCRYCRGTGQKRGAPCSDCSGSGEQLCDRCQGFGSVQK